MADTKRIRTGRIRLGRTTGPIPDPDASAVDDVAPEETSAVGPDAASVVEAPFPESRVLRWTPEPESGEAPLENDIALVVTQDVYVAVNRHVASSLDHEIGGFLLGNLYHCPNTDRRYLVVDQSTEALFTESSEVHLSFTLDTWAHLADEVSGKFLGKLVVGWYHSHPRMDVFLSSYDVAIHEERFAAPWTTALVIEPEHNRGGFFRWHDGKLSPRVTFDFYELIARRAAGSVVDWPNYLLAGGHRPDPPDRRARDRAATPGGPLRLPWERGTDDRTRAVAFAARRTSVRMFLAGALVGAALCGGAWAISERYRAVTAVVPVAAPTETAPAAPAVPVEPPAQSPPAAVEPPVEQAPPPSGRQPERRKPASKPKPPARAPAQGA